MAVETGQKPKNARGHQKLVEARARCPLLRASRGSVALPVFYLQVSDTDFRLRPPELWENKRWVTTALVICYSSYQ